MDKVKSLVMSGRGEDAMTDKIMKEAEKNGFQIRKKTDAINGYRVYLVKENVKIFVERWDESDGWHRRPEADVIADIHNFETLKKQADKMDGYSKDVEKVMGYMECNS